MTVSVLVLVSFMFFFDGMAGYIQGPIRAMGLQQMASYFAIFCFWVIAIPMAAILGLQLEMVLNGLWIGLTIAVAV